MEFHARLLKTVKDVHGTPYFKGTTVRCILDRHRVAWIKDALHLPLSSHEWEPTIEYYELKQILKEGLKEQSRDNS